MRAHDAQDVVIGLDLGTTDIKAIAFDIAGQPLARAQRPSGITRGADGAAELDPERVAEAAEDVLADVFATLHSQSRSVSRIGVSAAMHSLIPIGADGAPLAPAMTWADLRPQPDAEALWRSPAGAAIYARTGTPIHAMSPLAKLLWLRRARPDTFQRAATFAGLKEWLWRRWFGEWAVDASLASATGLYNLSTGQWDTEALALATVTPDRMPRIVSTTYARSDRAVSLAKRLGLAQTPLIAMGASDGALANLGSGALDGKRLALTVGTSLAVRRTTAESATNPLTRVFCYVLGPGRFVTGAASNSGGVTLEWLYKSVLTQWAGAAPTSLPDAFDEARGAPAEGLVFLPYIAGERAPLWSAGTSGALVGLRASHTAADILRAAVEGLLFNARWLVEQVTVAGSPPEAIIATGGVFQSIWIAQLAADILGLPVIAMESVDASARGAALLADVAAGARTWEQAGLASEAGLADAPRLMPRPTESARLADKYQRFRALAGSIEMGAHS